MQKRLFAVLAVWFCVQSACFAVDLPQRYETTHGFTMYLPSDWAPIPKEILSTLPSMAHDPEGKLTRRTVDYGFQRISTDHGGQLPFLAVQIDNSGRIPESELKRTKAISRGMKKGVDYIQGANQDTMSNAKMGDAVYDPETNVVWTELKVDVNGIGPIVASLAVMPTETGTIRFMGYSLASEYSRDLPTYKAIVAQTVVDEHLRYKTTDADLDSGASDDATKWARLAGRLLGIGLLGAVVYAIAGIFRS